MNIHSYKKLINNLSILWEYSSAKRRSQFLALIFLSVFNAAAEIISIGSIIPFLILVSSPDKINQIPSAVQIINLSSRIFPHLNSFQIFTLFFIFIIIISYGLKILFLRLSLHLSYSTASDLSARIFENIINKPYEYHLKLKTSRVITALSNKVNVVAFHVIQALFIAISSFLIILVIFMLLLTYNPLVTSLITFFILFFYFSLGFLFQKKLLSNSSIIEYHLDKILKLLQESLGSIRDIILEGSQKEFVHKFKFEDTSMRNAQSINSLIGISPKLFIEGIGIIGFLITAMYLNIKNKSFSETIPILGLIIFATQKVLPSVHSFYNAWSNIRGEQSTLNNIIDLLKDSAPSKKDNSNKSEKTISFNHLIEFKNICFSYDNSTKKVLKNVNLKIHKGTKIALIGPSGSGKSTFINILMGLLMPVSGEIWIDNKLLCVSNISNWRKKIAHVPQDIYLLDASIAENIAFGISADKINYKKINKIIKQIKLHVLIQSLEKGVFSNIGERGINLSGGQKQKIAIARALYKNASLIVFDEPTSSLDTKSQFEVIDVISKLGKDITVIMITHQTNSLKHFEFLLNLKNGTLLQKSIYI